MCRKGELQSIPWRGTLHIGAKDHPEDWCHPFKQHLESLASTARHSRPAAVHNAPTISLQVASNLKKRAFTLKQQTATTASSLKQRREMLSNGVAKVPCQHPSWNFRTVARRFRGQWTECVSVQESPEICPARSDIVPVVGAFMAFSTS